jgi:hypothetical protein
LGIKNNYTNNKVMKMVKNNKDRLVEQVKGEINELLRENEEVREKRLKKSKAFEALVIDLSVSTTEELQEEDENNEEIPLEKAFIKAIKAGQGATKCWYDVGKIVKGEVKKERNVPKRKIKTRIYNKLERKLKGLSRRAIHDKIRRAERIYKIFKGIGGKSKINRMRSTYMNTITNLKAKEVDELITRINEIEIKIKNNISQWKCHIYYNY